jgi:O-antigen ligase
MGTFNDVAVRLYPFPEVLNPGAHNLSLQVALDLGILGLVAYLSILLLTIFMAFASIARLDEQNNASLKAISIGLLAGFFALTLHGVVDIGVWGTRAAFLPWLIIGLITAIHLYTLQKDVNK